MSEYVMLEKCQKCKREFARKDLQEHHIIPKSICNHKDCDGARSYLCKSCHRRVTKKFITENKVWLPNNSFLKYIEVVKNA